MANEKKHKKQGSPIPPDKRLFVYIENLNKEESLSNERYKIFYGKSNYYWCCSSIIFNSYFN